MFRNYEMLKLRTRSGEQAQERVVRGLPSGPGKAHGTLFW